METIINKVMNVIGETKDNYNDFGVSVCVCVCARARACACIICVKLHIKVVVNIVLGVIAIVAGDEELMTVKSK